MQPSAPLRSWLLTLVCVMLLTVRVGGAHLHLCFDGREPPVSFHLEDGGIHHADPEVSAPHQDEEVMLADEATGKFNKLSFELPVLLTAVFLLWTLLRSTGQAPLPPLFTLLLTPAHRLRPPLRGPPTLLSH